MFKIDHDFFVYIDAAKRIGRCRYDVIATHDFRHAGVKSTIVVFTELLRNPGPSVTNAIESIVPQFCRATSLNPEEVMFVERYQSHPQDLDVINYQPDGTTSWDRLPEDKARPILELL